MPSTGTADEPVEVLSAGPHRARRGPPRIVVLPALVLVGALLGGAWWVTHPGEVFGEQTDEIQVYDAVGRTAIVGVTLRAADDEARVVTLRSVRPRLTSLPRGVQVDVRVCRGPRGYGELWAHRSLAEECAAVSPVGGTQLDLGNQTKDQLVLLVRSTVPQSVSVAGLDIRYSVGWQRGRESAGPRVEAVFGAEPQPR